MFDSLRSIWFCLSSTLVGGPPAWLFVIRVFVMFMLIPRVQCVFCAAIWCSLPIVLSEQGAATSTKRNTFKTAHNKKKYCPHLTKEQSTNQQNYK
jgi:hypothetical protein